jgi:DNA-directed RNA polymerase specialized sigma24 family protein
MPVTGGQRPEGGGLPDDPELPLSVLAEALRGFLNLPPRAFRILQMRYHGESYRAVGEELQVTAQAAESQLRRALEAHPHLKNLLTEKVRRQEAAKRERLSRARRGKTGSGGR